jgi:hypothetical protein
MFRVIMRCASRKGTVPLGFIHPTTTKLWTAITTAKVASIVKIDFHIGRDDIGFRACA